VSAAAIAKDFIECPSLASDLHPNCLRPKELGDDVAKARDIGAPSFLRLKAGVKRLNARVHATAGLPIRESGQETAISKKKTAKKTSGDVP
jgi:hypothetical protein